jgi:hypothetical protein
MKKRPEIRRLRFECLENRAMLAGNVVVSVVHHTLLIQGDGNTNGNAIIVSQTGRRSYTVTQDTVNVASTRLKKVNVNLGASDDNLKFVAALPHWRKSTVDGGTGTNTLTTPGKVITANGSFHHHDPDYRLTVLDFSNFA